MLFVTGVVRELDRISPLGFAVGVLNHTRQAGTVGRLSVSAFKCAVNGTIIAEFEPFMGVQCERFAIAGVSGEP